MKVASRGHCEPFDVAQGELREAISRTVQGIVTSRPLGTRNDAAAIFMLMTMGLCFRENVVGWACEATPGSGYGYRRAAQVQGLQCGQVIRVAFL